MLSTWLLLGLRLLGTRGSCPWVLWVREGGGRLRRPRAAAPKALWHRGWDHGPLELPV